jgi:hypothetical protein
MTKKQINVTTRFRVIAEDGVDIPDGNGLLYKLPYNSEFEGTRISESEVDLMSSKSRVDVVKDNEIVAMESEAYDDLFWTAIVNARNGVHLYRDIYLQDYIYTVPHGVKLTILGRSTIQNKFIYHVLAGYQTNAYIGFPKRKTGLPIMLFPIRHVLFGRVLNPEGLIVNKTKEVYSDVIGHISRDSIIYVKQKDFSELPNQNHVHRYELADGKGWINVYQKPYDQNIKFYGNVPPHIDPKTNLDMRITPMSSKGENTSQDDVGHCISCLTNERDVLFLHEDDYGHRLCCQTCAAKIVERKMGCPVCRQPILKVIQIF